MSLSISRLLTGRNLSTGFASIASSSRYSGDLAVYPGQREKIEEIRKKRFAAHQMLFTSIDVRQQDIRACQSRIELQLHTLQDISSNQSNPIPQVAQILHPQNLLSGDDIHVTNFKSYFNALLTIFMRNIVFYINKCKEFFI